jgi:hypothetical protein
VVVAVKQHEVQIDMTSHGQGSVLLDGVNVMCRAVSFEACVNEANTVSLDLIVEKVRVSGPAVVIARQPPTYFEYNAERGRRA